MLPVLTRGMLSGDTWHAPLVTRVSGEYDHILAAKLEVVVHDLMSGVYHIDLTIALPGPHMVTVRLDGYETLGSPMHMTAAKPRPVMSMKAAGKSRADTLYSVASAIANAGANWAFKSWTELAYEKRDKLQMLMNVASHLANHDILFCWKQWSSFGNSKKKARQQLDVALRAIFLLKARKGMNAWLEFYYARVRNTDLLKRALLALTTSALYVGFNTWYFNLYPEEALDDGSFESFIGGGSFHEEGAKREAPPAGSILGRVQELQHGEGDSFHVKVMHEGDEYESDPDD